MAETRETQVLEDVVNSTEITNPRTTEEAILAKIIAGEEVDINARTRYQAYLKELSSIGGTNPNYVETVMGTLASPWGDYASLDLAQAVLSNDATVMLQADMTNLGSNIYTLTVMLEGITDYYVTFGIAGYSGAFMAGVVDYLFADNSLDIAKMLIGDTVNDIKPYATVIPTILTIIHHPLPEDNT